MPTPEQIRAIEVVLTSRCNLKCAYCYQNAKRNRRMGWETLQAALDLALGSRRDPVRLLFYGGEPLLELPLIRRAVAYVEERRPGSPGIEYAIITNGMLLDEEAAAFLATHRFRTQVSFDGIAAAQAARGERTFAVLDRLLDMLLLRHPDYYRRRLSVSSTVHSATIPHLADSFDYFLEKGLAEIAFTPVVTHDPGWRPELLEELDRQFARIYESSLAHLEYAGEVPFTIFRKRADEPVDPPRERAMCRAGTGETVTVDVDGEVHGCVMFADSYQSFPSPFLRSRFEAMRMGGLRRASFRRRLEMYPAAAAATGLFERKQEKRSSYGNCGDCRFLGQCGVCPVSIGNIPGNTDADRIPDHLCAFNLVSLKYRERFPVKPSARDLLEGRAPVPRLLRELWPALQGAGDPPATAAPPSGRRALRTPLLPALKAER